MIRRGIGRLARRLRRGGRVGEGFDARQDGAFAELSDAGEAAFQVVGASVVGTWEVMLADLGRALGEGEKAALIERVSDGLVPTQRAFQSAGHRFRGAVQDGVKAGLASGRLSDVMVPTTRVLRTLGPTASEGLAETADYLEPAFDTLGMGAAEREQFRALGAELDRLLGAAADRFAGSASRLPEATDLRAALLGACDGWRDDAVRAVENVLYEGRTILVEAASQSPPKNR